MLASSSRRESRPEKKNSSQAKKVGCMSGIFYFLHLHRHNSRKRLPSGKRDNKTCTVSSALPPPPPEPKPPAAAEPCQKTPHNKRAGRPEVVAAPDAAKPGEKTSHNKRAARPEVVAPPAAAEPGEKTSHNKRSALHEAEAPAAAAAAAAEPGEKTSHNKRAAPPDAAAPAAAGSPGSLTGRLSCDVQRSPTLPSEIRRSNSAASTPARRSPALVARLMGLDDPPRADTSESAAEKRRKLLGALERCDEDLRALKKIIEALHVAESRRELAAAGLGSRVDPATPKRTDAAGDSGVLEKQCLEVDGEQPSPVSVLDALFSPPARRRSNGSATAKGSQRGDAAPAVRSKQPPHPVVVHPLQPGRHDKDARVMADGQSPLLRRNANIEALPRGAAAGARRAESGSFLESGPRQTGTTMACRPWRRLPCSRAMEESVDQVWEDGVWEERWELGRVAVALEGDILGDLVAEVVQELGFWRSGRLQLPFDACRKRLCY